MRMRTDRMKKLVYTLLALGMLIIPMLPCVADLKNGPTNWISPGGFLPYFWNQVGAAAIGDSTQVGNWSFGLNNQIPNGPPDDGFMLIKKAGASLYVDGDTTELAVGTGGTIVSPPQVDLRTQSATWTWQTNDPIYSFTIVYKMWLVRDIVLWDYKIINNTGYAHRVGFRTWESPYWNFTALTNPNAGPYIVPNAPPSTLSKEWGGTYTLNGLKITEDPVPSEWSIRFSPKEFQPVAPEYKPFLIAKQSLGDSWSSTPTRLVIGETSQVTTYGWQQILTAQNPTNWNQPPVLTQGVDLVGTNGGDASVGLIYPLQSVQPGQSIDIRGQIQMHWCDEEIIPSTSPTNPPSPYTLAVQAPEWVGYRNGPDPNDPTTTVGHFSPNPITVNAFLNNSSELVAPAVSVSIDVGKDLALVSGPITYSGDTVADLTDKNYQWQVRVKPSAAGQVPIRVTATFTPGGSVTVVRYINVPAIPAQSLQAGDYFTGFPYSFTNSTPTTALGLGSSLQLAWYDPSLGNYRYAATDSTVQLAAGRGYWLNVTSPANVALQGATPLDQRTPVWLSLSPGWNAISNPFQFSIIWGYCHVFSNTQEIMVPDAINQGLIRPELWSWDATNAQYTPPANPTPSESLSSTLDPNKGYWLYVTSNISLIFEPNPFLPPMDPATPGARNKRTAGTADTWQVNLVTEIDKARDIMTTFGIAKGDVTTLRACDIMKPPISPAGLSTYFPHPNWGKQSGNYALDIQAPAATNTWKVTVQCVKPNQRVTVRWPDLTQLPAKLPIQLTDDFTGKTISMRTTAGYTFNSGTGGVRSFTITAGGSIARLQFNQVSAMTGRGPSGVAVTYATTIPADVTVHIRTVTGRLVRTLSVGQVIAGLSTCNWDGRDEQGRLLPAGMYLSELYAESSDGQRVRAMLTLRLR